MNKTDREDWVQCYVERLVDRGSSANVELLKSLAAFVWERLGHLDALAVADEDWLKLRPLRAASDRAGRVSSGLAGERLFETCDSEALVAA
jgi:hypothetical protein